MRTHLWHCSEDRGTANVVPHWHTGKATPHTRLPNVYSRAQLISSDNMNRSKAKSIRPSPCDAALGSTRSTTRWCAHAQLHSELSERGHPCSVPPLARNGNEALSRAAVPPSQLLASLRSCLTHTVTNSTMKATHKI